MTELDFPELDETYATALQQAVAYLLDRYDHILGIIAAGSLLRGEGDANSDIDTFVIIEGNYRQRVQKFFNGVRFELFINAVDFVPLYFEEERRDGGASTAHMLMTGHVILHRDERIAALIEEAKKTIASGPDYRSQQLLSKRYMLADAIENGFDLRYRDPVMGQVLLDHAVMDMLVYHFQSQGQWVPRHKDLLAVLRREVPALAKLTHDYYATQGDGRFEMAGRLADYILGTRGFFEWESERDTLD